MVACSALSPTSRPAPRSLIPFFLPPAALSLLLVEGIDLSLFISRGPSTSLVIWTGIQWRTQTAHQGLDSLLAWPTRNIRTRWLSPAHSTRSRNLNYLSSTSSTKSLPQTPTCRVTMLYRTRRQGSLSLRDRTTYPWRHLTQQHQYITAGLHQHQRTLVREDSE